MGATAFNRLRQFNARSRATERCELCGTDLHSDHEHLLEVGERRLICACGACAVLFERTTTRKRVPRRVRLLSDFQMSNAQWDALGIPINLAFFVHSTPHKRVVAYYPSPAGATESALDLDTWEDIGLAPDVRSPARQSRRAGVFRGADRPVLPAGGVDSNTVEGALGGNAGVGGDRGLLQRAEASCLIYRSPLRARR